MLSNALGLVLAPWRRPQEPGLAGLLTGSKMSRWASKLRMDAAALQRGRRTKANL